MRGPSPAWRNVWLLSLTSLIADVSGEMLMAVLPFVLLEQGATGLGLGLVGGAAEAVGHGMKWVGGWMAGRMQRTRALVATGYLVAASSRFGVAMASTWGLTLAFRSLDRVGKGLRTAPRDALLVQGIPLAHRARAFGLHRAFDTTGAVVGVLVVFVALVAWNAEPSSIVLWGAAIGLVSVLPILFVHERPAAQARDAAPVEPAHPKARSFLAVSALFHLGHVTYLFFLVRATMEGGVTIPAAVLLYLMFNVIYAAASYPLGALADHIGPERVLLGGYLATAAAAVPFLFAPRPALLVLGFVMLGVSYAAVEGNGRALAARLSGSEGRARRLGSYHAVTGFATLAGGLAAGLLWDRAGPAWAFGWSIGVALTAAAALFAWQAPPRGVPPAASA